MELPRLLIVFTCGWRKALLRGASDKENFVWKHSLNRLAKSVLCAVIFVFASFDLSQKYGWGIRGARVSSNRAFTQSQRSIWTGVFKAISGIVSTFCTNFPLSYVFQLLFFAFDFIFPYFWTAFKLLWFHGAETILQLVRISSQMFILGPPDLSSMGFLNLTWCITHCWHNVNISPNGLIR